MEDYINWLGQKNKDGKTNKQILTDCSSIEAGNIAWQAALQSQWQPIETAPKDDALLIYCDGESHLGWWDNRENYFDSSRYPLLNATHWQPLPPSPKTGG